jgi:hypothetical protein
MTFRGCSSSVHIRSGSVYNLVQSTAKWDSLGASVYHISYSVYSKVSPTAGAIHWTTGTVQSTTGSCSGNSEGCSVYSQGGFSLQLEQFSLQWAGVQGPTVRSVQSAAKVGLTTGTVQSTMRNKSGNSEVCIFYSQCGFSLRPGTVLSKMRSCSGNSEVCSVCSQSGFSLQPEQFCLKWEVVQATVRSVQSTAKAGSIYSRSKSTAGFVQSSAGGRLVQSTVVWVSQ